MPIAARAARSLGLILVIAALSRPGNRLLPTLGCEREGGATADVQTLGDEVRRAATGEDHRGGNHSLGGRECDGSGPAGGDLDRDRIDDPVVRQYPGKP